MVRHRPLEFSKSNNLLQEKIVFVEAGLDSLRTRPQFRKQFEHFLRHMLYTFYLMLEIISTILPVINNSVDYYIQFVHLLRLEFNPEEVFALLILYFFADDFLHN